jgi:hypothetical protein
MSHASSFVSKLSLKTSSASEHGSPSVVSVDEAQGGSP